jgi:hypothetical protein
MTTTLLRFLLTLTNPVFPLLKFPQISGIWRSKNVEGISFWMVMYEYLWILLIGYNWSIGVPVERMWDTIVVCIESAIVLAMWLRFAQAGLMQIFGVLVSTVLIFVIGFGGILTEAGWSVVIIALGCSDLLFRSP